MLVTDCYMMMKRKESFSRNILTLNLNDFVITLS
jgi:uncharacterized protein YfkK (UPF0435 family)